MRIAVLSSLFLVLVLQQTCFGALVLPDGTQQISNTNFTVSTYENPPWVYRTVSQDGSVVWEGLAVEFLKKIVENVGTGNSYSLQLPYNGAQRTGTLKDNVWDGVMGDLINGNATLGIGTLSVTSERLRVIDVTSVVSATGLRVMTRKPTLVISYFGFLNPFEGQVWGSLGLTIIGMTFVNWVLDRLSPFSARQREKGDKSLAYNLPNSFYSALKGFIHDSFTVPRAWSGRVVVAAFAFFKWITICMYCANLTAALTTQILYSKINGVKDIATLGVNFAVISKTSTEDYFLHTKETGLENLAKQMKTYETFNACVDALKNEQVDAVVYDAAIVDFQVNQDQYCNYTAVGDLFAKEDYAFFLPKNSSNRIALSQTITRLREQGVMDSLVNKWYIEMGTCPEFAPKKFKEYEVTQLAGLWFMLLSSFAAAFCFLGLEYLVWNIKEKGEAAESRLPFKPFTLLLHCCGFYREVEEQKEMEEAKQAALAGPRMEA